MSTSAESEKLEAQFFSSSTSCEDLLEHRSESSSGIECSHNNNMDRRWAPAKTQMYFPMATLNDPFQEITNVTAKGPITMPHKGRLLKKLEVSSSMNLKNHSPQRRPECSRKERASPSKALSVRSTRPSIGRSKTFSDGENLQGWNGHTSYQNFKEQLQEGRAEGSPSNNNKRLIHAFGVTVMSPEASLASSEVEKLTSPLGKLSSLMGKMGSPSRMLTSPVGKTTSPLGKVTPPEVKLTLGSGSIKALRARNQTMEERGTRDPFEMENQTIRHRKEEQSFAGFFFYQKKASTAQEHALMPEGSPVSAAAPPIESAIYHHPSPRAEHPRAHRSLNPFLSASLNLQESLPPSANEGVPLYADNAVMPVYTGSWGLGSGDEANDTCDNGPSRLESFLNNSDGETSGDHISTGVEDAIDTEGAIINTVDDVIDVVQPSPGVVPLGVGGSPLFRNDDLPSEKSELYSAVSATNSAAGRVGKGKASAASEFKAFLDHSTSDDDVASAFTGEHTPDVSSEVAPGDLDQGGMAVCHNSSTGRSRSIQFDLNFEPTEEVEEEVEGAWNDGAYYEISPGIFRSGRDKAVVRQGHGTWEVAGDGEGRVAEGQEEHKDRLLEDIKTGDEEEEEEEKDEESDHEERGIFLEEEEEAEQYPVLGPVHPGAFSQFQRGSPPGSPEANITCMAMPLSWGKRTKRREPASVGGGLRGDRSAPPKSMIPRGRGSPRLPRLASPVSTRGACSLQATRGVTSPKSTRSSLRLKNLSINSGSDGSARSGAPPVRQCLFPQESGEDGEEGEAGGVRQPCLFPLVMPPGMGRRRGGGMQTGRSGSRRGKGVGALAASAFRVHGDFALSDTDKSEAAGGGGSLRGRRDIGTENGASQDKDSSGGGSAQLDEPKENEAEGGDNKAKEEEEMNPIGWPLWLDCQEIDRVRMAAEIVSPGALSRATSGASGLAWVCAEAVGPTSGTVPRPHALFMSTVEAVGRRHSTADSVQSSVPSVEWRDEDIQGEGVLANGGVPASTWGHVPGMKTWEEERILSLRRDRERVWGAGPVPGSRTCVDGRQVSPKASVPAVMTWDEGSEEWVGLPIKWKAPDLEPIRFFHDADVKSSNLAPVREAANSGHVSAAPTLHRAGRVITVTGASSNPTRPIPVTRTLERHFSGSILAAGTGERLMPRPIIPRGSSDYHRLTRPTGIPASHTSDSRASSSVRSRAVPSFASWDTKGNSMRETARPGTGEAPLRAQQKPPAHPGSSPTFLGSFRGPHDPLVLPGAKPPRGSVPSWENWNRENEARVARGYTQQKGMMSQSRPQRGGGGDERGRRRVFSSPMKRRDAPDVRRGV